MTLKEVLNRVNYIIDNHNHHELDLLRSDLEDDIIWKNKMRKYKKDTKKIKKQKFLAYQCTGDEVI